VQSTGAQMAGAKKTGTQTAGAKMTNYPGNKLQNNNSTPTAKPYIRYLIFTYIINIFVKFDYYEKIILRYNIVGT